MDLKIPLGEPFHRGPGWSMRPATMADNERLCELLRTIRIKSNLDVTQERDPDFFAMLRLHGGDLETWVAQSESEQRVDGMWSLVTKDAVAYGEHVRAVYHCDLRLSEALRGGKVIANAYGPFIRDFEKRNGVDIGYTVLFDSNRLASGALAARAQKEKRQEQPIYRPIAPFFMTNIQFTRARPKPTRMIERGDSARADELVEFLSRMQRRRFLGDADFARVLSHRLKNWPDFSYESFFIARNGRGQIAGVLAPWNSFACKRTRVLGYHGSMKWVKTGFNAAARVFGFEPLPAPGECFRFEFLTHMEIEDDDPGVLRDLLLAAYAERRTSNLHFLSACVPRGSRLELAFRGFMLNRTPMTLYAIHFADSRWAQRRVETLHPGFEMALS